jgi:hypothetical protein
MKKPSFILLFILLVGLVARGTNQSASSSHPVNVATKQIDPCSLVTKAQVEEILKVQVTITQGHAIPNNKIMRYVSCGYDSQDFFSFATISLEIYKDVASARAAFEAVQDD